MTTKCVARAFPEMILRPGDLVSRWTTAQSQKGHCHFSGTHWRRWEKLGDGVGERKQEERCPKNEQRDHKNRKRPAMNLGR